MRDLHKIFFVQIHCENLKTDLTYQSISLADYLIWKSLVGRTTDTSVIQRYTRVISFTFCIGLIIASNQIDGTTPVKKHFLYKYQRHIITYLFFNISFGIFSKPGDLPFVQPFLLHHSLGSNKIRHFKLDYRNIYPKASL